MPEDEPGIAHMVPDVIRKCLAPAGAPLQIFGAGEQTRTLTHIDDIADGIVTAMASPAGVNEDFNISASEELTVAETGARSSGRPAGGTRPSSSSSTCRGSRSTSCAAGRRSRRRERLLGWEARIGVREGIAQTVEWLREAMPQTA